MTEAQVREIEARLRRSEEICRALTPKQLHKLIMTSLAKLPDAEAAVLTLYFTAQVMAKTQDEVDRLARAGLGLPFDIRAIGHAAVDVLADHAVSR